MECPLDTGNQSFGFFQNSPLPSLGLVTMQVQVQVFRSATSHQKVRQPESVRQVEEDLLSFCYVCDMTDLSARVTGVARRK